MMLRNRLKSPLSTSPLSSNQQRSSFFELRLQMSVLDETKWLLSRELDCQVAAPSGVSLDFYLRFA